MPEEQRRAPVARTAPAADGRLARSAAAYVVADGQLGEPARASVRGPSSNSARYVKTRSAPASSAAGAARRRRAARPRRPSRRPGGRARMAATPS